MDASTFVNGATALEHWGLIDAQGSDAATFLHGQLTQDVLHLPAHAVRLAGYCTPKGRLLASFLMWQPEPGRLLLATRVSVLASALRRLSMFVLRAKVRLADLGPSARLYGLAGPLAGGWVAERAGAAAPDAPWHHWCGDGLHVLRLPDVAGCARYVVILLREDLPAPDLPPLARSDWDWLEVQSGIASIDAAVVEQFVPQMVNHELVGGVDFRKGCFPGQEIVARSQYRGTIKRRTFLVHADASMAPGVEVFQAQDPAQPCGQVVTAAPRPTPLGGGWDALAELKIAAARDGHLHLGAPDGPALQIEALPYPVPLEANELPADDAHGATPAAAAR